MFDLIEDSERFKVQGTRNEALVVQFVEYWDRLFSITDIADTLRLNSVDDKLLSSSFWHVLETLFNVKYNKRIRDKESSVKRLQNFQMYLEMAQNKNKQTNKPQPQGGISHTPWNIMTIASSEAEKLLALQVSLTMKCNKA